MLHTKLLIIDGLLVSVGSTNFDIRSFRLNDEASLNVYDRDLAAQMTEVFERDLQRAELYTLERWRKRPLRRSWARSWWSCSARRCRQRPSPPGSERTRAQRCTACSRSWRSRHHSPPTCTSEYNTSAAAMPSVNGLACEPAAAAPALKAPSAQRQARRPSSTSVRPPPIHGLGVYQPRPSTHSACV